MARNTDRTALRRAWQKVQDKPDAPALRGLRAVVIAKVAVICSDGVKQKSVMAKDLGGERTMTLAEWNSAPTQPSSALMGLLAEARKIDEDNQGFDELEIVEGDRATQAFQEGQRKGFIISAGQGFWKLSKIALQLFGLGVTGFVIVAASKILF